MNLDDAFHRLNSVLENYVNKHGQVDYSALRKNPFLLKRFIEFVTVVSPESRPDMFPTQNDEKAYWINVYNALVMKAVTDKPGISTVREMGSRLLGFFRGTKFVVGEKPMTLSHIENGILRKKYCDPRIHFAINCASNSCPPLGHRIFTGPELDSQLEKKAKEFIGNKSNVSMDYEKKVIRLSRIFKWYKRDFKTTGKELIEYILDYLPDISFNLKRQIIDKYSIKYMKYDWRLNVTEKS